MVVLPNKLCTETFSRRELLYVIIIYTCSQQDVLLIINPECNIDQDNLQNFIQDCLKSNTNEGEGERTFLIPSSHFEAFHSVP